MDQKQANTILQNFSNSVEKGDFDQALKNMAQIIKYGIQVDIEYITHLKIPDPEDQEMEVEPKQEQKQPIYEPVVLPNANDYQNLLESYKNEIKTKQMQTNKGKLHQKEVEQDIHICKEEYLDFEEDLL